jgi:hypothetical protein
MPDDPAFLSLYEPLDTPIAVADGVWVIDGPAIRMSFPLGLTVPFPTRTTIVRLANGTLWVHSPIRLTPALQDAVAALGPVAHLVSSNFIHYAGIPDWAAAFPTARAWASPGVRERAAAHRIDVRFDADLTDTPPPDWAAELDQHVFAGSRVMREVVFFHRASRTLILTDLIENFELDKLAPRWRWLVRLSGACHPDGKAPADMRATFTDRAAARASRQRLLDWDPERVILAHGRWYRENGRAEVERAFRWLG